ncbi:DUF6207 family protein [Streptomyces sp. NRRL F-5135]|uniref:DUF6207 family protein n=1 Tax=Streptomyces sp. NRRL F-5135 TaxID=1463858 RepID=UPI001F2569E4|nr:DUF6207 family protein [Streptomyces sp. NRRL F-5135]
MSGLVLCVRQINDAHGAVPGLAVVEVAAADDETALAVQKLLAARCAIAPADRTTREPGEPGVRRAASWTCARRPARSAAGPGCVPPASRGRYRGRSGHR